MHRDEYNRDNDLKKSKHGRPDFNEVFAKELGKHPNDWLDTMVPHRLINYGISEERIKAAAHQADALTSMLALQETNLESLYLQWEKTALLLYGIRDQTRYAYITEQTKEALVARYGVTSWRIRDFLQHAYLAVKRIDFRKARLGIAQMIVESLTTKEAQQQWGDNDKAEFAESLLALGKQEEALSYAEQAWACSLADPDSPRAYRCALLAGDTAMRTGDFPKAAHYYQIVIQYLNKRPRANALLISNLRAKLGEVRA